MTRVEGETRVIYTENPLDRITEPEIGGAIESFLERFLYPMPEFAVNPLCWKVRCDKVFGDFWANSGPGYVDKQKVEDTFWATAKRFLPHLKAFPRVFEETLVREKDYGAKKEKFLYYWKEVSYELDAVGYNESPPNPWIITNA